MQLYYKKAEVEHGAGYCEADDCESMKPVGGHAEKGEEDAEFKSKDTTNVAEDIVG